jgi:hypothetical protein
MKTPQPVLIMTSVLAGLTTLTSGAAFVEQVPRPVAGFAGLIVAALTAGWGVYVRGRVVPDETVVARKTPEGIIVAGPAAPGSIEVEDVVSVAPAGN